jgi:hypothetical protein
MVGSKRTSGNCEIMVKEIRRQVPQPHQLSSRLDARRDRGCREKKRRLRDVVSEYVDESLWISPPQNQ